MIMFRLTFVLLLLAVSAFKDSLASPYYYLYADPEAAPAEKAAQMVTSAPVAAVSDKVEQASDKVQEFVKDADQSAKQLSNPQLPQRIQGHINQLYSHGSNAMKSVVNSVQPDLKNIGQDLTDVYHVTRTEVGKKIEPLAQKGGPYLNQAQKVVEQTAQEVPKLINQAGPTLHKVGEQVRDQITGVWGRLTTNNNQQPNQAAKSVVNQASELADKAQQSVSNTVQQAAKEVENKVETQKS